MIHFDVNKLASRLDEIESAQTDPEFWNRDDKEELLKEQKSLKNQLQKYKEICQIVEDIQELEIILEEEQNDEFLLELSQNVNVIEGKIIDLENITLLSGEYDNNNAFLTIHPGAGGTESCDWADMLFRMYQRFTSKELSCQVIEYQEGDEAGIKSVTLHVKGDNAYGLLKGEQGVHRLVRISPFDSSNRRHTSFASVEVTPEIEKSNEFEIASDEIRVDTFRSSGAGGQSVNTTDSAVRITHLPTKIIATCQDERDQHANKEKAMKILKSKLMKKEFEETQAKLAQITGAKMDNEWGSQIRSYVMHPYSMVKDHRTNVEKGDVKKVMDGDIEDFIFAYLKQIKE